MKETTKEKLQKLNEKQTQAEINSGTPVKIDTNMINKRNKPS